MYCWIVENIIATVTYSVLLDKNELHQNSDSTTGSAAPGIMMEGWRPSLGMDSEGQRSL